jgi:hypothetical protein
MLHHMRHIEQPRLRAHLTVRLDQSLVRVGHGHRVPSERHHLRTGGDMEVMQRSLLEFDRGDAGGRRVAAQELRRDGFAELLLANRYAAGEAERSGKHWVVMISGVAVRGVEVENWYDVGYYQVRHVNDDGSMQQSHTY